MTGDETEYLQPILGLLPTQAFKPLNSSWVGVLLLFLAVMMEAAGLIMVSFWPNRGVQCEPLYVLLYCHTVFWFIVLFLDHVLKWHHNKLRLEGYLTAHQHMTKFGSLPFYVVSLGNTVVLVIITFYQQRHIILEEACTREWDSLPIVVMGTITLETVLMAYVLSLYLVNVHNFNTIRAPPDVSNVDTWESFASNEVGYREREENTQELLQKQADSIRYYKDTIEALQLKVMGLTAQLREHSVN